MSKQLTENQKQIIESLKKEFLLINENAVPKSKGLINVSQVKDELIQEEKFIAECRARKDAYKRLVHKTLVADIEKIRGDLQELGLDIYIEGNGKYCVDYFKIIEKETNKKLSLYIRYENTHSQELSQFGRREYIPSGIRLVFEYWTNISHKLYFSSIEELVQHPQFLSEIKWAVKNIGQ